MKKNSLVSILYFSCVFAYGQTFNDIDNGYKGKDVEHGLHFYDENKQKSDELIDVKKVKKEPIELLSEIVRELQSQREELKQIKKTLNPNEPRKIINAKGEECITNSSIDCMDIPVILEGRNMPALYNFIKEPTQENAENWLKLQAGLFNHYIKMGFALKFAALNGDENTYPVNALNIYTSPKDNITSDLYKDRILEILDEKKNEIGTLLFLGKSKIIEEHWGKNSVSVTSFKKGKFFNIALVFDTEETKKDYDKFYNEINDKELAEVYKKLHKVVSPKLFEKYKINLTPTAVAVYKNKDKEISSVIERGYITQNNLIHNYQNFLVYNNIVEPKEFHSAKIWNAKIEEK